MSTKREIFKDQMLPFMQIITHPNVLASLVLEQAVVTIYNCIFGPAGRRGEPLLGFLADAVQLEIDTKSESESKSNAAPTYLELSLLVFWQVVELNSTAFIQEPLKPIAQRFADHLMVLHALDATDPLHQSSYHYLERLQRRLEIGLSLPTLSGTSKKLLASQSPVAFVTQKDPPGGRHDNDHADICKIQIMPTFQEILCSRSEYLPVKDPRQWHVDGLAGLLDRNFRLLREDTVGQLRNVIHAELQPRPAHKETRKSQTRAHVYRQFLVRFAQPANVRGMAKKKQQEWWELSKRLQSSALVCLLDPQGHAIFCTVTTPDRPRTRPNATENQRPKLTGSFSEESNMASVMLELVEPTESNWQYILDCHAPRRNRPSISLVEFPGILLPSFQPTLLALQRMQKAADIPMSEFLASNDLNSLSLLVDVPPPVYAAAPGFSFDLQCLMDDGSSLKVQHSQPVDMERLQKQSKLDDAQALALVRTLQRRMGLIQGPPGTGKSFTGVALIKVLLANKAKVKKGLGPIICVCYTNHALDQLLEDLLENKITSQIIRIGSQSKSERLQPLNLRTVSREVERTRLERSDQWLLHTNLDGSENRFHELKLDSADSEQSLKKYLARSNSIHYDQFFAKDKDGFRRVGSHGTIQSWLNGGQRSQGRPRGVAQLKKVHVDMMTAGERRVLHAHWLEKQKEALHSQAQSALSSHLETKASLDRIRDELDLRCLRAADVIGVTTTGLARNLNMLRRLPSKVLMCEEAGEVLEAHLLTSLLPSVEQVILIGDHQQLRPQIQNYELSRESQEGQRYSLDRSLFERLVEPDDGVGIQIPFCTLETQRRMHPSISRLIRDSLYPRLQDAPSVSEYPEVIGMRKRLFWLDHQYPEGGASSQDPMATSHWNDHEIDLSVALVNHLLHQGTYQSGDIAVLTPYLGQLHRMRQKLSRSFTITLGERDQEDLDNAGLAGDDTQPARTAISRSTLLQTLRVATVDNFQGEEAKVVVISLVRSNSQGRCGFLRTPNRINVLLSRAKHGMYIIGNSATSRGVEMWGKVLDILETDSNIGPSLDLSCPRHPETPIAVSEPEHFVQFSPEGGCSLQCGKRLQCGHPCKQKCHSDMLHMAVYCLEPCQRPQKGCTHPCPKLCGDPCPKKCTIPVFDADRLLPCGHQMASLPCWQAQDLSTVNCPTFVNKQIPHCDHQATVACHIDVNSVDYQCTRVCQSVLQCGHNCRRQCLACTKRTTDTPQVDHGTCTQKCGRLYSTCAHACTAECHGEASCPPCTSPCSVQCGHSKCPRKCSEPCAPCAVSQCLSSCQHSTCTMPCAAPCDHVPCSQRCEKSLPCGHQCPSVCGELCPPGRFCQVCGSDSIRDTPVDFILGELYREVDLTENPCMFPQCGHFLTVESMDAQMDLKKHYIMDETEKPVSIASSSQPFSIDDIRTCATCRGSLRNLSRYGRLVRRALLDEATKKFILYLNQQYIPMAQDLPRCLSQLQSLEGTPETAATAKRLFQGDVKIRIEGPPEHQVRLMRNHVNKHDKQRWKELMVLREKITEYKERVKVEEQPFNQVRNMVEAARRRKRIPGQFEFDENVLQTKGHLQAASLLLRLDTALLGDFLSLKKQVRVGASQSDLHVNLGENKKESKRLIDDAVNSHRVLQQAEGNLFVAQLCALERQSVAEPTHAESLLQEGTVAIEDAQRLCDLHPRQTRGLAEEIEGTRVMLRGATFYTPVSNEERMAVLAAMAQEFRGTGHWYYCENGHPFTIGECGGAMQLSRCPECGSPVGGQSHRTATGVTHAHDLEQGLRGMRI
ncbi:hypothetical protein BDW59DRAFT_178029 [Aspergillus cavernicola]|uniref:RZ-type domain-containing protein n=1 Tax=Aspergillus cavernicola TaxID=176166 RepID=A0ABR4IRC3_9EURO